LNVYLNVFKPEDDVCLVIKDMGSNTFYEGRNISENIDKYQNNINYPDIEYITENLSDEDLAALYRTCDVFVSPYRGEGFCLPALEAMACGLPVIVTEGGATDDFVDESCGWLVPSDYQAIGNSLGEHETVGEVGWLNPNQEVLGFVLQEININPSKLFSMGLTASFRARKYWTWRNSTLKVFSRLDSIYGTKMSSKALKNLPEYTDKWIELGEAEELFNEGYFTESSKLFLQISQSDINDEIKIYSLNVLALIELDNKEYDKAMAFIDLSLKFEKNNIDSKYLESKIYSETNKLEKALETINPVVENWVENKWKSKMGLTLDSLITFMGKNILEMDDPEAAIELFETALLHNPANLEATVCAGLCFKANGEIEKAKDLFESALEIDGNYLPALEQLENLSQTV
ncbi:glycosyltransferase, partial [Candidatus Kapabacteria bacterium]|nr:glycosyltransferase [Candidatus Kapabacteria bacterium]